MSIVFLTMDINRAVFLMMNITTVIFFINCIVHHQQKSIMFLMTDSAFYISETLSLVKNCSDVVSPKVLINTNNRGNNFITLYIFIVRYNFTTKFWINWSFLEMPSDTANLMTCISIFLFNHLLLNYWSRFVPTIEVLL